MRKLAKKGLAIGAFLGMVALTAPAFAQLAPGLTPPPVAPLVDQNEFDLNSGVLVKPLGSISIGPGGPGSLAFKWTVDNSRQWPIFGYIHTTYTAQYPGGPIDTHYSVTVNGLTETFTQIHGSSAITQDQGRPSTFNPTTNTYTGADGMVALFNGPALDGGVSGGYAVTNTPVTQVTYPRGQQLNYYWDTTGWTGVQGNLIAVGSSLGYQLRLTWSGTQLTSAVVFNMNSESCDPAATSCTLAGNWPKLTWDAVNKRVVDNTGKWVGYTTDSSGTQVITYPSGRTITFSPATGSYNDGKGTTIYRYSGQYTSHIALPHYPENNTPGGPSRVVQWQNGLLTADTVYDTNSSGGLTTTYQYGSGNRVSTITHPDGTQTQYSYDIRGNLNQVTQVASTPGTPPNILSTAVYPSTCANIKTCNQPTSVTDARGNTTDYTYDPNSGGVATVTLPAPTAGAVRPQTRSSYTQLSAYYRNGSGVTVAGSPMWKLTSTSECQTLSSCTGSADEVKTSITYDPNNALLPISVSEGSGDGVLTATTATTYTANGDVATVDGPLPGSADVSRNYYDTMRRPLGSIGPAPGNGQPMRAQRTSYDSDGRPATTEAGTAVGQGDNDLANMTSLQQQVTGYDAQGRVATIRSNAGGTTYSLVQKSYGAAGTPDCEAVRMNAATFGAPPADACTLGTQGSYGPDRITKYAHDGYYRATTTTTGYGTADAATEVTNGYDSVGRLHTTTDANSNVTTYNYDGMSRLQSTCYADSISDCEALTYDPNSNLSTRQLRSGDVITYAYDALNRLTLRSSPSLSTVTYSYDNLGRMLTTANGSGTITHTYDALGRTLSETGPQGIACSSWDLAGRRTLLRYPGPSACTVMSPLYVNYDYLVTGEVQKIRENGATSGAGVLASYAYDALGNRQSVAYGNGASLTYAYDPVSRMQTLTADLAGTASDLTHSLTYSPASEIASLSRSNDAYAFPTGQIGNVNRSYTPNALNQYTAVGGSALGYDARGNLTQSPGVSGAIYYCYDVENRLLATGAAAGCASPTASLGYDAAGRLLSVTASGATTNLAYDGLDLIAEYNGSTLTNRYVFAPTVDEPILAYDGSGNRSWLFSDERGSVIAATDASGNASAINRYDEYGIPASTNSGRFQYTGQVWLPQLGMYYYKARMYSTTLGRFMQTDPIGYADGLNWYAYVHNNPVNGGDPSGTQDDSNNNPSPSSGQDAPNCSVNPDQCITITGVNWHEEHLENQVADLRQRSGETSAQWEPHWLPPGMLDLFFPWGRQGCVEACLEAGTLVATPAGLKPIEQIAVGDLVLSENPQTGKIAAKKVMRLIRPEPKPVYELALRDIRAATEKFRATGDHRWLVEARGWIETDKLRAGDRIKTGTKKANVAVISVLRTDIVERTYNLEVAGWHTFMIGADRVIVHNGCPNTPVFQTEKQARQAAARNGWKETNKLAPGGRAKFYRDNQGNLWTMDRDGHIGGAWKKYDRSGTDRLGTYDINLNRIGK